MGVSMVTHHAKVTSRELRRIYDDLPGSYDRANALISFFQDVKWRAELIKAVINKVPEPARVLDVGSGRGELGYVMHRLGITPYLVMLDYSERMLRSRIVDDDAVLASFELLPFREKSFDAVISSFALHAADDMERVVKGLAVISRGSVAVIAMGKSRNTILRTYTGLYMRYVLPYLACLVHGKSEDYKYIYRIYTKIPTNDVLRERVGRILDLELFVEKAMGTVYLFTGKPSK
jgi:demethylmenaquinone methyltransferase/2-methoxy-6-polyprenyl-1,4-benzoquinol methylase